MLKIIWDVVVSGLHLFRTWSHHLSLYDNTLQISDCIVKYPTKTSDTLQTPKYISRLYNVKTRREYAINEYLESKMKWLNEMVFFLNSKFLLSFPRSLKLSMQIDTKECYSIKWYLALSLFKADQFKLFIENRFRLL